MRQKILTKPRIYSRGGMKYEIPMAQCGIRGRQSKKGRFILFFHSKSPHRPEVRHCPERLAWRWCGLLLPEAKGRFGSVALLETDPLYLLVRG